ncbi:MAG TPA: sigma-54 dependent transcriptional regulator [candidate division Zixibacteria bacterium]|jgi:two-component system response regulator AtoC
MTKVLIIDDGEDITSYCKQFISEGFEYFHIYNGKNIESDLAVRDYKLVLLDKSFAKADKSVLLGPVEDVQNEGLRILKKIKEVDRNIPVIMVTSFADYDSAALALHLGAYDYVEWDAMQKDFLFLKLKMQRALEWKDKTRQEIIEKYNNFGLVGKSEPMIKLFQEIEGALCSDSSVLLLGETGSGKDLVAQAIHSLGKRKDGPFISVNCPAIPKNLLESELFGIKRRVATEVDERVGKFLLANTGTIFLNEIGDLPLDLQAKLLKVVEEKKLEPIGATSTIELDVRVLSATNKELETLVKEGLFREDLYFRLKVLKIKVPSLKERKEDIPLLIDYFVKKKAKGKGKEILGITSEAKRYLEEKSWTGNVRELENAVSSACEKADRLITLKDLVNHSLATRGAEEKNEDSSTAVTECSKDKPKDDCPILGKLSLDQIERLVYIEALRASVGNVDTVARVLGVSKATVYNKINIYDLGYLVSGSNGKR